MLHLLHVKAMYNQPMHHTHELILCIQMMTTEGNEPGFYNVVDQLTTIHLLGSTDKPASWTVYMKQ